MGCDTTWIGRPGRASAGANAGRGPAGRRRRDRHRLRPELLNLEERRLMATFIVNNPTDTPLSNELDLRQAISDANSPSATSDSTIKFDVGTSLTTIILSGGVLDLTNIQESITIDGTGAGVTVSGGGKSGVFEVGSGVTASITGLTITDGHASGGAGIDNAGTTTLTDCTIDDNSAASGSGGGVSAAGSATLSMTDCTISGNSATAGGGMFINCKATITDSTIAGNSASSPYGGGGGLLVGQSGDLELTGCTVSGNTSAHFGGGVYAASNSIVDLRDCTLAGNTAEFGGGLNNGGKTTLTACTISGNSATKSDGGGGVYNYSGSTAFVNTIVAGNTVAGGASDILDNTAKDASGVSGSFNLIGTGGSGSLTNGVNNNIVLTGTASPNLAPLGYYGGPTETIALLPVSPAIGKGTSTILTTDQRGFALDATPDIGAFQTQAKVVPQPDLVVNTTADADASPAGDLSLRQAIALANLATTAQTITFDTTAFATAQTIALTEGNGDLELSNTSTGATITITGPGPGVTVEGPGDTGVFQVDEGVTASITGLTITGGSTTTSGGGLDNSGTLTLTDCTISGNTAAKEGGGLVSYGYATLTNSTVSGNSATDGGGLDVEAKGTLILTDSTVSGNSAAFGGGLRVATNATATLTNSTVSGNSATTDGGLRILGAATLTNCTVSGNSATVGGADLDNQGIATLNNTIVADDVPGSLAAAAGDTALTGSNNLIGSVISTNLTKSLSNSLLNADPDLQSLANNGGPTETMALQPDSPAINAGDNGLAVDPITQKALTRDQTGINERVLGRTVNIGAYESPYISTSTGLTSSASNDTSTYGTSVIFTATVSDIESGTGTPTGSVEFYDGSTDLGPGTALSGSGYIVTSKFTTSTLDAATHGIYAVYAPTGDFLGGTSSTVSQIVTPATLTAVITASNKVYDVTTAATLSKESLTGLIVSGDAVSLTGGTASFSDPNVGTGKQVTATGLSLTGSAAANYQLASTTATTTADISPAGLTVSGITAATKVYNASTAATLITSGAALKGVYSGDTVTLGTSGATGTFAGKDVGTGIAVSVAGLTISGAQAGDYTLTQPTTTANITPAGLTVSGLTAVNKVYNASTGVTLNTTAATLNGVFSGDTVALGTSGATGAFASKDVGTSIAVSVAGLTISGAQASDYTLTQPATTANITPAGLTVSGLTAANQVYDASTAATLNTTGATLKGVYSGDTVSLGTSGATGTFAAKDVGTGIAVSVAGLTLSGGQASDYTLTQPATTANITPAGLTVSGITAASQVYDASTTATLITTGAALKGVYSGDTVTLGTNGATGAFASKDVGTGIAVSVAGLTISGAQASDYILTQPTATANITPAGLTVSGITAASQVYDASTTATLITTGAALKGVYSGDTVVLGTGERHGHVRLEGRGDGDRGVGRRSDHQRRPGQRLHTHSTDGDGEYHSGRFDGLGRHRRQQGLRRDHRGHAQLRRRQAGGRLRRRRRDARHRRCHRHVRLRHGRKQSHRHGRRVDPRRSTGIRLLADPADHHGQHHAARAADHLGRPRGDRLRHASEPGRAARRHRQRPRHARLHAGPGRHPRRRHPDAVAHLHSQRHDRLLHGHRDPHDHRAAGHAEPRPLRARRHLHRHPVRRVGLGRRQRQHARRQPGERRAGLDLLRRLGHIGQQPRLDAADRPRDVYRRGQLPWQRRLRREVHLGELHDQPGDRERGAGVLGRLGRVWPVGDLHRDGRRRRHQRHGHILGRRHDAGHRRAGRLEHGRADHLGAGHRRAVDHGELRRQCGLRRRDIGSELGVGREGRQPDRAGAAGGHEEEEGHLAEPGGEDRGPRARRGRAERHGDVRGEEEQEEGDRPGHGRSQRRRGDAGGQAQQRAEEADHDHLRRRCELPEQHGGPDALAQLADDDGPAHAELPAAPGQVTALRPQQP